MSSIDPAVKLVVVGRAEGAGGVFARIACREWSFTSS